MGRRIVPLITVAWLFSSTAIAESQWKWLGAGRRAGTLPWNDNRLPDELSFEGDGESGRIVGTAKTGKQTVAGQELEWFGKEARWEIARAEDVPARMTLLSRCLPEDDQHGPQCRIRILDKGGQTIATLPLLTARYEVVYLRMNGPQLVLSDLSGGKPGIAEKVDFPLTVAINVAVRKLGEAADTRIRVARNTDPVPVVPSFKPLGEPQGLLNGRPARYYLWHEGNHWHLRSTSVKYRSFRGLIHVLNGQLAFAKPIGFEKSQIDLWQYSGKKGELRFAFKTGRSFDGIDFRVVGRGAIIVFDIEVRGRRSPENVFIGPEFKTPPAVPFAFPARPRLASDAP